MAWKIRSKADGIIQSLGQSDPMSAFTLLKLFDFFFFAISFGPARKKTHNLSQVRAFLLASQSRNEEPCATALFEKQKLPCRRES